MLIQDRIRLIMKSGNLSASEFADKIDIKRSNLSHVLSGRNKPSLDFLEKIINAYPNVNASWLITGETREGELQEPDTALKRPQTSASEPENKTDKMKEVQRIVLIYRDGTFDTLYPNEQ